MTRIELVEHEAREIVLPDESARTLQSDFAAALELVPSRATDRWRIRAKHHVGSIVVPGAEIMVRPKCGTRSLFYLLSYAYGLARIRRELVSHAKVDELREFLLSIFAKQLDELLRRGLRKGYVEREERIPALRGQLLLAELLSRPPGRDLRIPCRFEEFTPDLVHNQILRYTLQRVAPPRDIRVGNRLRRARKDLAFLTPRAFRPRDIDAVEYDRLTAHYQPLHQLCALLLEGSGAENELGPYPLNSFLVDMNKVFESFVEAWLREHLPDHLSLLSQHGAHLDRGRQLSIRPDLVFFRRGDPVLVADTKYKRLEEGRPPINDAYQILAYCRALGLESGLLIYADFLTGPRRYEVRDGGNVLRLTGLNMSEAPEQIEEQMGSLLDQVLEQIALVAFHRQRAS